MKQQVILAVVAVGLVSGAIWAWHQSSQGADVKSAAGATTLQSTPFAPARSPVVSDPAPEPAAPPAAAPVFREAAPAAAAPDVNQNVSAQVDPPNVDAPEPAQRKFARGGRADESDQ